MNIFQIVVIGIIGAVLSITIKKHNAEMSLMVALATGIIIFFGMLDKIGELMLVLKSIADVGGINSYYITWVLKVIGIAYIAEFGVQLCKDAGENSIAAKVELSGKILIMVVSAPVLLAVLDMAVNLIG